VLVNKKERGTYVTGHELHPAALVRNTSSSCAVSKLELETISKKCESLPKCSQKSEYLDLHI
jgi:hypothetical protein